MDQLEISDVIVEYDPKTLARRPVEKRVALERLGIAPTWARRIIEDLPEREGVLDPEAVDARLLTCHAELQRLWEELRHPARVARLLRAAVATLRQAGSTGRLRVVDIGCGPAFVLRWLAAHGVLEGEVSYIGADYNGVLIDTARRLAATESLPIELMVGNALTLREPADIVMSTGVLHHFRGEGLSQFFHAQRDANPKVYMHFDIQPSWAAPIGAKIFHVARMRDPMARYDGTLSAMRAHSGDVLVAEANNAGGYRNAHYAPAIPWFPMVRTIHGVLGVKPTLAETLAHHLGRIPIRWT